MEHHPRAPIHHFELYEGLNLAKELKEKISFSNKRELELFGVLGQYYDHLSLDPFEMENESFRSAYLTHSLNHLLKTRKIPNSKGYTKPRVLILVPYKADAFNLITQLISIFEDAKLVDEVLQKEKFEEKFAGDDVIIFLYRNYLMMNSKLDFA